MAILTVGPGQRYTSISAAVAAANSGDTIDVQAGIYTNDFPGIYKNLSLQAVGGVVKMVATVDPPNGKAIIDEGGTGIAVTINGFDISGAVVPDGNGAAIRYEGGSLSLNHDYFHNNQEGLLAASDPNGTININNSEFAFNGSGSGFTHNIYVNHIATLSITGSYFHDASVGHEIKSRAANTVITDTRIFDNLSTASYSIDLPNGGNATIQHDVIQQGPNTQNPNIIAYGEEGVTNPGTNVLIADNIVVNDLNSSNAQVILNRSSTPLNFSNNQIYGTTRLVSGPLNASGTLFLTVRPSLDTSSTWASGLCFLSGTRIALQTDEARVEHLRVDDLVRTIDGSMKRIVWIGIGRVLAVRGHRNAATPVIVRKGALADNVPHSDLRVTKGHSLYIDGALIPVEYLVNHRSILWDDHAQQLNVYHIELERHDVLLANGAPAESYRDDGNRWLFQNTNANWDLSAMQPCAPVLTGGPIVDDVWRRLLKRAGRRPGVPMTDDPDLHLLVDGRRANAASRNELHFVFRLADRPTSVRINSRSSIPQELGLARDPRPLGVAIRQIVITQGQRTRSIHAADNRLHEGFHNFEKGNSIRWTNGDADLPHEIFDDLVGPIELRLDLGCSTRYAASS